MPQVPLGHEIDIVYETIDDAQPLIDESRISVPRSVIVLQGILLLIVGIFAFVLGNQFGRSSIRSLDVKEMATPCVVSGRIDFTDRRNRPQPDAGAVIMLVPRDQRPDINAKAPIDGLRPGDPDPLESHDGLRALKQIGGEYVRADANGNYRIQIMSGKYFVLIISRNAKREANDVLDKQNLAEIGRYVESALDLLDDRRFEWREIVVGRDRTVSYQF